MSMTRRQFAVAAAAGALESCAPPIVTSACALRPATECPASPPLPIAKGWARCELYSYNEMQHETPWIYRPECEAELAAALRALKPGQQVTFRGGGQSLDQQSLNAKLVIALDAPGFSHIGEPQSDADGYFLTTGAGARWWDVICKLGKRGLFPPSLVTAADATVGGTLSADCVSRMSAVYGKEGRQIRSFRIMLADGSVQTCNRGDSGGCAELFNAVIGGFGYLGAVIEVTFDLVAVRSRPSFEGHYPQVFTRSTRHAANVDWHQILSDLQAKSLRERQRVRAGNPARVDDEAHPVGNGDNPVWSALSIASYMCGEGMTANLLEQRFVEGQALRPTPGDVYNVDPKITVTAAHLSAWWPTLVELASDIGFPSGEFVDELFGWAFFFGNWATRAKEQAHSGGERLNYTQHTFALPARIDDQPDTRPARRFIEALQARLHGADIRPPSIDFLYVPADRFLMSASRDLEAYLITISLAAQGRKDYAPEVREMLCGLARDCRALGGRVHLVKSVVADPEDLRAMYGEAALAFKKLKLRYDPHGYFKNAFFERVFEA